MHLKFVHLRFKIKGKMQFKIGDKVQFLNETGGGVITAVLDNKMVKIKTGDGFEMPVLSHDLILDYRSREVDSEYIPKSFSTQVDNNKEDPSEEDSSITEISPFGKAREEEGIYLVFEPHDQQWLLTGDVDIFLVNHTGLELLYNLFLERDGGLKGVDYGSVTAESKILLDTVSRDGLDKWNKGIIQILFNEENPERIYFPIHSSIDIRPNRFFKEGSYQSNTLTGGKALISVIALRSSFQIADGGEFQRKFETKGQASKAVVKTKKPFIEKYKTAFREAVVDLHIGEVVDNIAGLSSHDMLDIQVNHFKKALNSAIENDYQKVTFIHGVGNGILKNKIIDELKDYEHLENRMASITKFGVGAIDVIIKEVVEK